MKAANQSFPFSKNDVVLAKYEHELFYAKILRINYRRKTAKLVFDDKSVEDISFRKIYDVNETTSDIICVVCKRGSASKDNDIVLCDGCNVGFHQNCHDPVISSDVLKPEIPWECSYCSQKAKNPHIECNPFEEGNEEEQKEEEKETEENVNNESVDTMYNAVSQEGEPSVTTPTKIEEDVFEHENNESKKYEKIDYGEQVIIAHADSTSNEEDDEDLIVDVESDDDGCLPSPTNVKCNPIGRSPFDVDRLKAPSTEVSRSCYSYTKKSTDFNDVFINAKDKFTSVNTDRFCHVENLYHECLCGTEQQQSYTQKTKIHKPRTRIFHPYLSQQDHFPSVNSHYIDAFYQHRYLSNSAPYEQITFSKSNPLTRPGSDSRETLESSSSVSSIPSIPSPGYDLEVRDYFFHQNNSQCELFEYPLQSHGKQCLTCGHAGILLCSGCRKVNYCSKECQWSDWKYHMDHCSAQ